MPDVPAPRSLRLSANLILATVLSGLSLRFASLGLPGVVTKYGGSLLWAIMLYWLLSSLLPRRPLVQVALLTALLATAVEFFKLYHLPPLDAFRRTLPGMLLLGRFFSVQDVLAYWLAIAAGSAIDVRLRRPPGT